MSWLINAFGSKKLTAMFAAVVAAIAVPILNKKLGLGLDAAEVANVLTTIGASVLAYIAAQWHVDVKTNGQTTTAYAQLAQAVAGGAAAALPKNTIAAQVAAAVVQALKDETATRPAEGTLAVVPPVAPPAT